jgi:hypothetical protein
MALLLRISNHLLTPSRPQLLQRPGQQIFDAIGLPLTDVPREDFENRPHDFLRIDRVVIAKDSRNVI